MIQNNNDDGSITLTVPVSPDMLRYYVPTVQFTATGSAGKPFASSQADCMRMVDSATSTTNGKVVAEYGGSRKRLRALLGRQRNERASEQARNQARRTGSLTKAIAK